ncbi:MAG: hypothetical protein V4459_07660 [Pseudomonadota bacterium]
MKLTRFDALMHFVCVDHGYCGGIIDGRMSHVTEFIPAFGIVSADQFADGLIRAEGPAGKELGEIHRAELRAAFVEYMGADTADAADLRWSDEQK